MSTRATFDVKNTGEMSIEAVRFELRITNPFGELVCPHLFGWGVDTSRDLCVCTVVQAGTRENRADHYVCDTRKFILAPNKSRQVGCELPNCSADGKASTTVRIVAFTDGSQWRD